MHAAVTVAQLLVAGVGTGSIYALIALGFNVVFKSTGAMNFAQGEWVVMGGMTVCAAVCHDQQYRPRLPWRGPPGDGGRRHLRKARDRTAAAAQCAAHHLDQHRACHLHAELGDARARQKAGRLSGFSKTESLGLWGITLQSQTLWIFGITLVFLVVMHLFFERSMLGKALRAAAADREAAAIVGVKVETTVMLSFAIAAFAGALAGAIITPLTLASYDQGAVFGFKGFSAAMLGGVGSLPGAVVGGLALGLLEAFGSFYISSDFKDAIAFAVLLLILFARPSGLLGRADMIKV